MEIEGIFWRSADPLCHFSVISKRTRQANHPETVGIFTVDISHSADYYLQGRVVLRKQMKVVHDD
jgi:hypothetical protein